MLLELLLLVLKLGAVLGNLILFVVKLLGLLFFLELQLLPLGCQLLLLAFVFLGLKLFHSLFLLVPGFSLSSKLISLILYLLHLDRLESLPFKNPLLLFLFPYLDLVRKLFSLFFELLQFVFLHSLVFAYRLLPCRNILIEFLELLLHLVFVLELDVLSFLVPMLLLLHPLLSLLG